MFEHTEGDVDQFAHDRADDGHFGFACGAKSGSKVTQGCIVFDGYQGRHVESLAKMAIALFAQTFVATHRGAALFAPRSQAGMSGSLAGALDLARPRHL